jgi:methylmalonyl-CoA mutase
MTQPCPAGNDTKSEWKTPQNHVRFGGVFIWTRAIHKPVDDDFMTDSSDIFPFGAAFEPASDSKWRALAEKALRGAPLERLTSRSADGIEIPPLHPVPPGGLTGIARPVRKQPGHWSVLARIDHIDPAEANRQALADTEGGTQGLHLAFAGSGGAFGFGLPSGRPDALRQVLANIDPAQVVIALDIPATASAIAQKLAALIVDSGLNPSSAQVAFGLDPLGTLMHNEAPAFDHTLASAVEQAKALSGSGFTGPFLCADARLVHAAGGSEAQELACLLGAAAAYLRGYENAGFDLPDARGFTGFRIAADADQFLTIAKLRALRRLVARLEEACGLAPEPISIHAETAWRMTSRTDPWVNVLRATVAVFSAVAGGADSISVLPHTQAIGLPDAAARRLARNVQLVLQEESHLAQVDDPAGGAGGIEALTEALCQKAWALFQQHEANGGIVAAIASGSFGKDIAAIREQRAKAAATARAPITGTSAFPNIAEATPDVSRPLPDSWDQSFADPYRPCRLSAPFEGLRARAAALKEGGRQPQVFLANLGPLAEHNARANFAMNFLAAGGIATVNSGGFDTPVEAAAAFAKSGCAAACICSTDSRYGEQALAAVGALKDHGACRIFIVGRSGNDEASLRAAGLDGYLFQGADMISFLDDLLEFFEQP